MQVLIFLVSKGLENFRVKGLKDFLVQLVTTQKLSALLPRRLFFFCEQLSSAGVVHCCFRRRPFFSALFVSAHWFSALFRLKKFGSVAILICNFLACLPRMIF